MQIRQGICFRLLFGDRLVQHGLTLPLSAGTAGVATPNKEKFFTSTSLWETSISPNNHRPPPKKNVDKPLVCPHLPQMGAQACE